MLFLDLTILAEHDGYKWNTKHHSQFIFNWDTAVNSNVFSTGQLVLHGLRLRLKARFLRRGTPLLRLFAFYLLLQCPMSTIWCCAEVEPFSFCYLQLHPCIQSKATLRQHAFTSSARARAMGEQFMKRRVDISVWLSNNPLLIALWSVLTVTSHKWT